MNGTSRFCYKERIKRYRDILEKVQVLVVFIFECIGKEKEEEIILCGIGK